MPRVSFLLKYELLIKHITSVGKEMSRMRKPRVKNYYNLSVADVKRLRVGDRSGIDKSRLKRDADAEAWFASEESRTAEGGCAYRYWLRIYDEGAREYSGKFRFSFAGPEGGRLVFKKFYNPRELADEAELEVQERFLDCLNQLIDDGVLVFPTSC